jgi:hypothetical protein
LLGIERLTSLRRLNIARNVIQDVGTSLEPLQLLQELNLADNLLGLSVKLAFSSSHQFLHVHVMCWWMALVYVASFSHVRALSRVRSLTV